MGVALLYAYRAQSPATKQVSLTEAIQKVDQGQVKDVTLQGNTKATLETTDGNHYDVALTGDDTFSKAVLDYNTSHPQ
ncbi:MAG: ATP-dependent metallopeptidase FtsH/Yme1/Tma family protein, partial [Chloroflexota bacterium]|nr:ATP-dependent metallopeptidase FtsH/Yme1/Tma family protein [Chloroflexota bacterium]